MGNIRNTHKILDDKPYLYLNVDERIISKRIKMDKGVD